MDRRKKRLERRLKKEEAQGKASEVKGEDANQIGRVETSDGKFARLLAQDEDVLLSFVAKINKLYQEILRRPAPFVSFVICGMQSSGKSTIMERFLNAPLNIVQEGTGTRCPLDTTCIHDSSLKEPKCELSGEELHDSWAGMDLTTEEVFTAITEHNKWLAEEDKFSTKPLTLVYRASNVQNMRFVDTPGIIANKGTGKDNRDDIKSILRDTMKKPNSKLCVLVEPKEFSTNAIIDFCDETFGGKGKWVDNAIVIMTKFDKQLEDSRSGIKANKFFSEYHENNLFPYLTITPTLASEDLDAEVLFMKRKQLLENSPSYEEKKFSDWKDMHEKFRETDPNDPMLVTEVSSRLGFPVAANKMREVMLTDTATRLPEVLMCLRKELGYARDELDVLEGKKRFRDPNHLKLKIGNLLHDVCKRIVKYLDGDLEAALSLPHHMMDLEFELEQEEDSEWTDQTLGTRASVEDEEHWRNIIAMMLEKDTMPQHVCADKKFLGGKQFQRAKALLMAAMTEAFPDISKMKAYVASGAGYLQGGLQRENWERATLSIVKMTSLVTLHPGINFLIKHVGTIFRKLFQVALMDIKMRSVDTSRIIEICPGLENCLAAKFDDMLWIMMQNAAEKTHVAMEPWYSCLDPSLPGFQPRTGDHDECEPEGHCIMDPSGKRIQVDYNAREGVFKAKEGAGLMSSVLPSLSSFLGKSVDERKAKEMLRQREKEKAEQKKNFLPDNRTSMITDDESEKIVLSAFHYVVALQEQVQTYLNFQINHYLYNEFKENLAIFPRIVSDNDWSEFIPADSTLDDNIQEIEKKIKEIKGSLVDVQKMQTQI